VKCYIVRIYREDQEDRHEFAGVVEMVGAESSKAFSTFDEFCEIIGPGTRKGSQGTAARNEMIRQRTRNEKDLGQPDSRKHKGILL
jgi:hypothetical protein